MSDPFGNGNGSSGSGSKKKKTKNPFGSNVTTTSATKTTTPSTPKPQGLKLTPNDMTAIWNGISQRVQEAEAKAPKKPEEFDLGGTVLNAGASFLNTIFTPAYWVVGGLAGGEKIDKPKQDAVRQKYDAEAQRLGNKLWFDPKTSIGNMPPKGQRTPAQQQYADLWLKRENELNNLGGTFDFDTANKNALAWTRGEEALTGKDVGMQTIDPLTNTFKDAVLDPFTWTGFGVITKPLGALKTGAAFAGKAGIAAATKGQVAKRLVIKDLGTIAKEKGIKLDGNAVENLGTKLKTGADAFNQYTNKPLLKANKRTGRVYEDLVNRINTKYTYEVAPGEATFKNVILSMAEAGYKAGRARLTTKIAKRGIEKDLSAIARTARADAKTARKQQQLIETLGQVTAKEADNTTEIPTAVVNGETKELLPYEMHVNGRTTYVMDSDSIVHKFTSQKAAKQFIAESANAPTTIKPAVKVDVPIMDSKPVLIDTAKLVTAKAADAETQAIQRSIKTVDSIISKVKGVTNGDATLTKVRSLLDNATANNVASRLTPDIRNGIKQVLKGEWSPLSKLQSWMAIGGREAALAKEIGSKTVFNAKNGKEYEIMQLLKLPFDKLPTDVKKQVIAAFKEAATAENVTEAQFITQLAGLVGEEAAKKIAATGILRGEKYDRNAVQAILDELPGSGVERTYANITELALGVKNGDVVDQSVLVKIMQALSPESAATKQMEKALKLPDGNAQIRSIFYLNGAQTMSQSKGILAAMNAGELYKAQGISMADTLASYTQGRLQGILPTLPQVDKASRQAASARIADMMNSSGEARADVELVLRSITRGYDSTFKYLQENVVNSPGFFEGVSTLGDLAQRSTQKAFQADTTAVLVRQLNTNGRTRIDGQLLGLSRRHNSFKKVGKESVPIQASPAAMFDDFLYYSEIADDALLSILGARTVVAKTAKAAQGEPHYIYFHVGDFARIMNDLDSQIPGSRDLAIKALIADTRNVAKAARADVQRSNMSSVGIAQAVRIATEQFEKSGIVNKADLVASLTGRAATQTEISAARQAKHLALANDIADVIASPEFIAEVQKVHTLRASATVEDIMGPAQSLTADMFNAFFKGWQAINAIGLDNEAARADLARQYFNDFAFTSGIFEQQSGEQAQAILRAAAQLFTQDGRLKQLADEIQAEWLIGSPSKNAGVEANQMFKETMDLIAGMYKHENVDLIPTPGTEGLKTTTAAVSKATNKLTAAEKVYETAIEAGRNITTKAEKAEWDKMLADAQKGLDVARQKAGELGVPTRHWDNGMNSWVPSGTFDYAGNLARAKKVKTIFTEEGSVVMNAVTDSKAVKPKHVTLSKEASKQWIKEFKATNNARNAQHMANKGEEVAEKLDQDFARIDSELAAQGIDEAGRADLINTVRHTAQQINDDIEVAWYESPLTYKLADVKEGGRFFGKPELPSGIRMGDEFSPMKTVKGKLAVNSGRADVQPLLGHAENSLMRNMTRLSVMIERMHKRYRPTAKGGGVPREEFIDAFRAALSRTEPPAAMSELGKELVVNLRNTIETVVGKAIDEGIDAETLMGYLKSFGVNHVKGGMDVSVMNPKSLMSKLFEDLPFGPLGKDLGDEAAKKAEKALQEYIKSGDDPFLTVQKILHSIQSALAVQRLNSDFVAKFGWKNEFKSLDDAIKNGYVGIRGVGVGTTDLSKLLPTPAEGGLFPPYIAEQYMSMQREWARLYDEGLQSVRAQKIYRGMMEYQGFMKAWQTIFKLGHHFMNMTGDTYAAIVSGTRNPRHWMLAHDLNLEFMADDLKSKWLGGDMPTHFRRFVEAAGDYERPLTNKAKGGELNSIKLVKNKAGGGHEVIYLDRKELVQALEEWNVMMNNIYAQDIAGTFDSVLIDAQTATGAKASMGQKTGALIRKGIQQSEKYPGTVASWYGNVPRTATALRIIESRPWNSLSEALDEAIQQVNLYHPNIQALSATERRYLRPAATYYTWLRGAHAATIDMFINHYGATTLFYKWQYNVSDAQGYNPESFGNPWSRKAPLPSYVTNSRYAPVKGLYGDNQIFRPAITSADVLNTWNFNYDFNYNFGQNLFRQGGIYDTLAGVISSSQSISVKPFSGILGGNVDPTTGRENPVKDFESLTDTTLGNYSFWTLYKGLGGLTLTQQKERDILIGKGMTPEEATQAVSLSKGEKDLYLFNWTTGLKVSRTDTEANMKNYRIEQSARTKALLENIARRNGQQ